MVRRKDVGGEEGTGYRDRAVGGTWKKKLFRVMVHLEEILLCSLSPVPIRRWAFLSHLLKGRRKMKAH